MSPRPALLPCLLALLPACAAGPAAFTARPEAPLLWPPTGQPARIAYEFSYAGTMDTERHPGFWTSVGHWVLGEEERRFGAPYGLAIDHAGELLYVADPGAAVVHRISLLNGSHGLLSAVDGRPLQSPVGVLCLEDDSLLVSDSAAGRIYHFDADGEPLGDFASGVDLGRPTGMAWDATRRRVLVLDTVGGRLLAFDVQGKLLQEVGGEGETAGEYNHPTNLAVAPDGRIFLTDSLNFRVQILDPSLQPIASFGIAGTGPGAFAKPKGIALDSEGHVYVVDGMFDNVQIFDQEGRLLLAFGAPGSGYGGFTLPTGLLIDAQDRIFVADSGNRRIQVFRYLPQEPVP